MPLSGTKFLRAIIPSGDKAVRNFWALRTLKLAHRAEHLGHQSLPSAHLNPIEDQGLQETSPKLATFSFNLSIIILLTYLPTYFSSIGQPRLSLHLEQEHVGPTFACSHVGSPWSHLHFSGSQVSRMSVGPPSKPQTALCQSAENAPQRNRLAVC